MVSVLLTQYEAYVLSGFGDLLFQLLALESASVQTSCEPRNQAPPSLATTNQGPGISLPGSAPPSRRNLDEEAPPETAPSIRNHDASHRVLAALALQGPQKHFSQPPFCCIGWFMKPHDLSSGQLLACFFLP